MGIACIHMFRCMYFQDFKGYDDDMLQLLIMLEGVDNSIAQGGDYLVYTLNCGMPQVWKF